MTKQQTTTEPLEDAEVTGTARVVAHVFVLYWTTKRDGDGNEHRELLSADRGQTIVLDPGEEGRLDALQALAPKGYTAEDVEAAIVRNRKATHEAQRAAAEAQQERDRQAENRG